MSSAPQDIRPRRLDAPLSLAFLLALLVPWVDVFVRPALARSPAPELREAAKMPEWPHGLWSLSVFPERAEKHFNDTFGLRDWFLRCHSIVQVFGLGISATPHMEMGKDQWLFLTLDHSVPIYRGIEPLTDEEITRWLDMWTARRDYLAQRGIRYLVVLSPNKETIYPELVADRFNRIGPTRREQMMEALRARPDLPVVDLTPALQAERRADTPGDYTYVPLGTHWNGRGHDAAYRGIVAALRAHFPAIQPIPREELVLLEAKDHGDSWADRMYIGDLLTQRSMLYVPPPGRGALAAVSMGQGAGQVRVFTLPREDLPRGVILHDSFGGVTNELLSTVFRSLACQQVPHFDVDFIARAKPDVVIELYVERILYTWLAEDFVSNEIEPAERAPDVTQRELFRLDLAQAASTLRASPGTEIAFQAGPDVPRALVRAEGGTGRFYLPAIETIEGSDIVVRAEIETRVPGCVQIYFKRDGDADYLRTNYRWALLEAGTNTFELRFTEAEAHAPFYFLVASKPAAYAIRALSVLAVESRAR
ncbi:MAG: alginate O-acetyltransferase AlgX-related protein [Planctomycetota bacterium]